MCVSYEYISFVTVVQAASMHALDADSRCGYIVIMGAQRPGASQGDLKNLRQYGHHAGPGPGSVAWASYQ